MEIFIFFFILGALRESLKWYGERKYGIKPKKSTILGIIPIIFGIIFAFVKDRD